MSKLLLLEKSQNLTKSAKKCQIKRVNNGFGTKYEVFYQPGFWLCQIHFGCPKSTKYVQQPNKYLQDIVHGRHKPKKNSKHLWDQDFWN